MKECRAGKIDYIITKSISHFGQNILPFLQSFNELIGLGITIYFELERLDSSDWRMLKIITAAVAAAQSESESKSTNIKWGIQRRFEKGHVKLNYTNFLGYTKDENSKLVIIEEEAEIVRLIYDLYLKGYSCRNVHEAELHWLNGEFPLMLDTIQGMVIDRCDLPEGYNINTYKFFQGMPTQVLQDGDTIDLGGRVITALHTPGHSPGHLCFWEPQRGYLFTGDLVYKDTLFAYYPSTDPQAYLASLEKIAVLPVKKVFPAHHSLDIQPEILIRM